MAKKKTTKARTDRAIKGAMIGAARKGLDLNEWALFHAYVVAGLSETVSQSVLEETLTRAKRLIADRRLEQAKKEGNE